MNFNVGKITAVMLFCTIALLSAKEFPDDVVLSKNAITAHRIRSHIDFLSSDFCAGREAGDEGIELAAKYITTIYKGTGIKSAGQYGGYYQDVDLVNVTLGENIEFSINESNSNTTIVKKLKLGQEFLPIMISGENSVTAPIVFAGYGITAPEHKYDDYKGINAKGKIVLVMRHEPGEKDSKSPFDGRKNSKHGTVLSKILNAQKHGAVAIIFVTDPLNHKDQDANDISGTSWPSIRKERYKDDKDFQFMSFKPRMRLKDVTFGVKIPAINISGNAANYIMGKESLANIQKQLDETLKSQSIPIPEKTISLSVYFDKKRVDAFNIVAKVEGSGPELKNEYIIVGAHYDHVGKNKRGQIYPGADDNASGTSGVMELARAFNNLKEKPKRSILFVLFTAEEKGLYGSRFYVENPIVPLEKTKAMFNLDMISRNDANQFALIGKYQYPQLINIVEIINQDTFNFEINFSIEGYVRNSDHFPFLRKKIPSIFFNTGSHDQLHRPEDTVSRILPEKASKITRLIFLSVWDVANMANIDVLGKKGN